MTAQCEGDVCSLCNSYRVELQLRSFGLRDPGSSQPLRVQRLRSAQSGITNTPRLFFLRAPVTNSTSCYYFPQLSACPHTEMKKRLVRSKMQAEISSDDEDSDVERNFMLLTGRRRTDEEEQHHGGPEEEEEESEGGDEDEEGSEGGDGTESDDGAEAEGDEDEDESSGASETEEGSNEPAGGSREVQTKEAIRKGEDGTRVSTLNLNRWRSACR